MASNLDYIIKENANVISKELDKKFGKVEMVDAEKFDKRKKITEALTIIAKGIGAKIADLIEIRLVNSYGNFLNSIDEGKFYNPDRLIKFAKEIDPSLQDYEKLNKYPIYYQMQYACYTSPESIYYGIDEEDHFNGYYYKDHIGPAIQVYKMKKPICICENEEYMNNLIKDDIETIKVKNWKELVYITSTNKTPNIDKYFKRTWTFEEFENSYKFWITYSTIIIPIIGIDSGEEIILGSLVFGEINEWDSEPLSNESYLILEGFAKIISNILNTAYLSHQWKLKNIKLEKALNELKEAQEIIVRTKSQAKYAEFSEQINHQINTLMFGILPEIDILNKLNIEYSILLGQLFSRGFSEEDRKIYFDIENFIDENVPKIKTLTGLEFINLKNKIKDILSSYNIKDEIVLNSFLNMQLPDYLLEKLINLYKKYGIEVIETIYKFFENRKILSTMKTTAKRISDLVSAIRDYTYGGKVKNYDVKKGLESTLMVLEVKLGGVLIHKDYLNKEVPNLETCYPGALDQVWTNIILNAVEAGAKNIKIDIYMKDEENIAIKIENDGPEIPQDILQKIFDRYFSTKNYKNEGKGIGLYMSKEIVEKQHNGKIEVYSDSNKTYFEIILSIKSRGDNYA